MPAGSEAAQSASSGTLQPQNHSKHTVQLGGVQAWQAEFLSFLRRELFPGEPREFAREEALFHSFWIMAFSWAETFA